MRGVRSKLIKRKNTDTQMVDVCIQKCTHLFPCDQMRQLHNTIMFDISGFGNASFISLENVY